MKTDVVSLLALICIGCALFSFTAEDKFDKRLVGVWKGFEKDKQIEGFEKHWIQQRFKDGKYVIMFTAVKNCEVETFTELGKWWVENGKFYKKNSTSTFEDIYEYKIIDKEEVKFKSIKMSGEERSDYEFSDFKMFD